MAFIIRPLAQHDKPAVMGILRSTQEFEPAEVPVAEEVLDSCLASPGNGYQSLVAEEHGAPLGFICFGMIPLTIAAYDVYWLAVKKGQRRQGVGRALLVKAETEIKIAGGYLVLIETSSKPGYRPARSFYRRCGYQAVSRIRDFYAPGDHRVTFAKKL